MLKLDMPPTRYAFNQEQREGSDQIIATAEDIKQLDLYTDLTWLPKHNEGIDKSDRAPSEGPGENEEEQLTKRELGRMKNKRRVLEKVQEASEKALEEPVNETN